MNLLAPFPRRVPPLAVFMASLGVLALLSIFLALPAFGQGPAPSPAPPMPTPELTTTTIVITLGSVLLGLLTQMQQSGKLFGQWTLPASVMSGLGIGLPFVGGVVGYISSAQAVNGAVVFYAVMAGIADLYGSSAAGNAVHAHFVVPAHMANMRAAGANASTGGGGIGGGGSAVKLATGTLMTRRSLIPAFMGPALVVGVLMVTLFVPRSHPAPVVDLRAHVVAVDTAGPVAPALVGEGCAWWAANKNQVATDGAQIASCIVSTIFSVGTFDPTAILAACSGATIVDVEQVLASLVDFYVNGPDAGATLPAGAPATVSNEVLAKLQGAHSKASAMRASAK